MRERSAMRGMMMAALMMGAMDPMRNTSNSYNPEPGPPITDPKSIQQQHRFIIGGKEVWARNKKDALKRAKQQH